jgi:uncharacterized protein YxeA
MTVKIAPLLAHYLYTTKRLDLPGIGTFLLSNSVAVEPENNKQAKNILLEGISFESNPSIKEPTDDLVQFISTHSRRIKPLAAADLDSYLWLALQFINIGKPYLIEGIGTVNKVNAGGFGFTAGYVLNVKLNDIVAKEEAAMATRDADESYRNIFYSDKSKTNWKKPVAILLIIVGIGLAIWGGYTVYKKTSAKEEKEIAAKKDDENKTKTEEQKNTIYKDTTNIVALNSSEGKVKYILEASNKVRAEQRFNKLKNFQWPVEIETKDSITYKVFMLLASTAADTTRIKDSLFLLYGKRVFIEK